MKRLFYLFLLLCISSFSFCQSTIDTTRTLIQTDKGLFYDIPLEEVVILSPLDFTTSQDRINYYRLRNRVIKVYPFAKISGTRLKQLNDRLENIESKRKQKKYIKLLEKFIYEEFEPTLKEFNRVEGQILIKLIHRQTGITCFDLLKQLRSGWTAFWWQFFASQFELNLKKPYQPLEVKEDYDIERILHRAFYNKVLEPQEPINQPTLDSIYKKWETDKGF